MNMVGGGGGGGEERTWCWEVVRREHGVGRW